MIKLRLFQRKKFPENPNEAVVTVHSSVLGDLERMMISPFFQPKKSSDCDCCLLTKFLKTNARNLADDCWGHVRPGKNNGASECRSQVSIVSAFGEINKIPDQMHKETLKKILEIDPHFFLDISKELSDYFWAHHEINIRGSRGEFYEREILVPMLSERGERRAWLQCIDLHRG